MASPAVPRLLTAEEFLHLPEPIEGGKMELDRGREMETRHGAEVLTSEDAGFGAEGFMLQVASIFAE